MYNLNLQDLRYLLVVAKELHFRRSADLIGIPQPQLTKIIHRLEDSSKVQLFTRKPKVQLTPAGEIIIEMARRILAEVDRDIDHARAVSSGKAGTLRFGFAESAKLTDLAQALHTFRRDHPDVKLALTEGNSACLWNMLEKRELDLIISAEIQHSHTIKSIPIKRASMELVLPENHGLSNESDISLRQLQGEQFILSHRDVAPSYYDQILHSCHKAGLDPIVSQEADSASLLFALVRAGFGLSFAHAEARPFVVPGVVMRPIREEMPELVFWLSYAPDALSPSCRLLRDLFLAVTADKADRPEHDAILNMAS